MSTVLLVIHLMVALALIVMILLQRSEGGALGIGGGGGGLMSGRGAANLLTRTTAYLAAVFFATSITLAILAKGDRTPTSILDTLSPKAPVQKKDSKPVVPNLPAKPVTPAKPVAPSVPDSK
jgi:preprotein translocase subunit SecG